MSKYALLSATLRGHRFFADCNANHARALEQSSPGWQHVMRNSKRAAVMQSTFSTHLWWAPCRCSPCAC